MTDMVELLRAREEWRRTDLSGFSPEGWTEADPFLTVRGGDGLVSELRAGEPLFTSLFSAALSPVEEALLGRSPRGFFVSVPPGAKVEEPIELRYGGGGEGSSLFHRATILLGEGAEATVIEALDLCPGGRLWVSALTEIRLAAGARLTYLGRSLASPGTWSFWSRRAELASGAELRWAAAEAGGRLLRRDDLVFLRGEESSLRAFYLLVSGRKGSQVDGGMTVEHETPGTVSRLLVRGLVGDGRVVFRGRGRIVPGARGSSADHRARGLLLGSGRFDIVPGLLIGEHEVEASHGAVASAPDEEELF
jgi:Fe-S cluster assembly scaffold protein SufB